MVLTPPLRPPQSETVGTSPSSEAWRAPLSPAPTQPHCSVSRAPHLSFGWKSGLPAPCRSLVLPFMWSPLSFSNYTPPLHALSSFLKPPMVLGTGSSVLELVWSHFQELSPARPPLLSLSNHRPASQAAPAGHQLWACSATAGMPLPGPY